MFGECFVSYDVCCLICVVIYVIQDAVPHFVFLSPLAVSIFSSSFQFLNRSKQMSQGNLVLISECLHCVRHHFYFHLHFHFDTEKLPLCKWSMVQAIYSVGRGSDRRLCN